MLHWLLAAGIVLTGPLSARSQAQDQPDVMPVPKFRAQPQYPYIARILDMEGEVVVEFIVNTVGGVSNARVVKASHPVFNEAALSAVQQWQFRPGQKGGTLVNTLMQVPIQFTLQGKSDENVSAVTSPPKAVFRVLPKYPLLAETSQLSGEVELEFVVNTQGRATGAKVVSSTNKIFEAPALAAIEQWLFMPALKDGKRSPQKVRLPIAFNKSLLAPTGSTGGLTRSTVTQAKPADAVYPFAELIANKQEVVSATLQYDESGKVATLTWPAETPESFRLVIEAMLDAQPAKPDLAFSEQKWRWEFNPYDGDVRITDSAAGILKQLRLGDGAGFVAEHALDQPPELVKRIEPVFPTRLADDVQHGEATIEFFVAENGRVLLPKIVSASAPAFGHAAIQAVTDWQFTFPRQNGETTVAVLQRQFEFNRSAGDDLPGETEDIGTFNGQAGPAKHEIDAAPVAERLVRTDYPQKLRDEGIRGTVVLSFVVTPKGGVLNPRVENQTQQAFAAAALEALNQSTFKPGRKDGRPVHTRMQLVVHFTDPLNQSMGIYEPAAGMSEG